jgi:hypothetical protein
MNCYQNFLILFSHRVISTNRNEWRFMRTAKELVCYTLCQCFDFAFKVKLKYWILHELHWFLLVESMGSFGGHILPGTFFLLFGIWRTDSMFSRYFKFLAKRRLNNRSAYYSCTATYQCSCLPNVPIEGYCKV